MAEVSADSEKQNKYLEHLIKFIKVVCEGHSKTVGFPTNAREMGTPISKPKIVVNTFANAV